MIWNARFARPNHALFPAVLERYGEQVHVEYQDMPFEGHPWAIRAAVDTNCLAKYSAPAYWAGSRPDP
jgi:hypothetical protein